MPNNEKPKIALTQHPVYDTKLESGTQQNGYPIYDKKVKKPYPVQYVAPSPDGPWSGHSLIMTNYFSRKQWQQMQKR